MMSTTLRGKQYADLGHEADTGLCELNSPAQCIAVAASVVPCDLRRPLQSSCSSPGLIVLAMPASHPLFVCFIANLPKKLMGSADVCLLESSCSEQPCRTSTDATY
jgi:hypothetical protein